MAAIQPIRLLRGNDFQQFASVLLAADDPEFRAIRGDGGDFGADGFTATRSVIYQAYAPDGMNAHKVRKKIDDSLAKAQALRDAGAPIRVIRFLTPIDLTFEQDLYLQNAARVIGIGAEPWGETRLLELLARHAHVAEVFPETLYPSVVAALRELRAIVIQMVNTPPLAFDTRFIENAFGETPVFPHVYALQRHDSPSHSEHSAYAYWRAWVYSPALELPSIEPEDEDAFVAAIHSAFAEDQNAAIDIRGDDRVWVEHRGHDLKFHRRWGRWTLGTVAMACNVREWRQGRADGYSLADVAVDVTRFLEMAGRLVPPSADTHVRLELDPSSCRLMLDPSDDMARERLAAVIRGVSSITRPVLVQSYPRRYEGVASGAYLRTDARCLAADFLARCTKHFHQARVDTKQLAASIPELIAANFRARSM